MTTPEPGKWYTASNRHDAEDALTVLVKRVEFGIAYCTPSIMGFPVDLRVDEFTWHHEESLQRVVVSDVLQEQEVPDAPKP